MANTYNQDFAYSMLSIVHVVVMNTVMMPCVTDTRCPGGLTYRSLSVLMDTPAWRGNTSISEIDFMSKSFLKTDSDSPDPSQTRTPITHTKGKRQLKMQHTKQTYAIKQHTNTHNTHTIHTQCTHNHK